MRISDWSSDVCSSDLEGLPGADGLTLKTTERQTVRIGHRAPSVAFPGSPFILPSVGEGLPVATVNVEQVAVNVYRITDRRLLDPLDVRDFLTPLSRLSTARLAAKPDELAWKGARKIVVYGQLVSVRVDLGLRRIIS